MRLVERLFDEIERTALDGGNRHVDVAMPGDQYDRCDDAARNEMTDEVEPRHARHADVGYDAVEPHAAIECGEKRFARRKA